MLLLLSGPQGLRHMLLLRRLHHQLLLPLLSCLRPAYLLLGRCHRRSNRVLLLLSSLQRRARRELPLPRCGGDVVGSRPRRRRRRRRLRC